MEEIPFNRPSLVGTETAYIEEAVAGGWISSGGSFSARCSAWLRQWSGAEAVLLTHSCTAALEAAAILGDLGPGDEVIMPSFTFVSTANAFVLRGAVPVFVDVLPDTLNLDPEQVADAVTDRTRAIVPVHYAGVACAMDELLEIARRHDLLVIEDAAQGILSTHRDRPLGSIGDFGTLSFHETKNVTCGEGGALLVNDPAVVERAEVVWDKGTDRARFFRGQVDKYTWVDVGSSYGLGEVASAFLWGQLERAREITDRRLSVWRRYHEAFAGLERDGVLRRPIVPDGCSNNAHMYYLLLGSLNERTAAIAGLAEHGVRAVFHYVPLHEAPAGLRHGRAHGDLRLTTQLSERLLRLPLWEAMSAEQVQRVVDAVHAVLRRPATVDKSHAAVR